MTDRDKLNNILEAIEAKIQSCESKANELEQQSNNMIGKDWQGVVHEVSDSIAQILYSAIEVREAQKRWMLAKEAIQFVIKKENKNGT